MHMHTQIKSLPFVLGMLLLTACATAVPGGQNGSSSAISSIGSPMKEVSDGTIRFSYPSAFALTTAPDTLPTPSAVPACDTGFDYCVRYAGEDYAGTNFNSAGVGIRTRVNIGNKEDCLNAQPEGHTGLSPVVRNDDEYSTSLFASLGDAGAGHFTHERLYRLFVGSSCYEILQRIGQSQFANYPEGTVQEFTASREQAVQASLDEIVNSITLDDGDAVAFPGGSESSSSCGPNNVRCAEGTTPTCANGTWKCVADASSSGSCGPNNIRCAEGTTPTCGNGTWNCVPDASSSSRS
jgi:hypothetical protein